MSTQRGNTHRTRPPKHKNLHAFKNSMHDTTNLTQMLNNLEIYGVCARCKDQIQWRIKYKKYKPLPAPKKCVKCSQKAVKRAYTAACEPCGNKLQVCVKCLQPNELVQKTMLSPEEENSRRQMLEAELKVLPERKRRTFERQVKDGTLQAGATNVPDVDSSSEDSSDTDAVRNETALTSHAQHTSDDEEDGNT